jgi:hypothetical protein
MLRSIARSAKDAYRRMRSAAIYEPDPDPTNTVFLSSGARTGSTWVSDIINYRNDYRYMFEPFSEASAIGPLHGKKIPQDSPANYLQYIRPENDDPELVAQAALVLSGRLHHPIVDQHNRRFVVRRRLIKEVKANLWIKWMHRHFPKTPIVLLLRHPIPTIRSRYRRYFDGDARVRAALDKDPAERYDRYLQLVFEQDELTADHLAPFRGVIEQARSVVAQRVAVWCIQNYVPLRQCRCGSSQSANCT